MNLVPSSRNAWTVGRRSAAGTADDLPDSWGRTVWEGRVELPRFEANRIQRHVLPLPEALKGAGPGLYALIARLADGTRAAPAALPVIVTDLGSPPGAGPQGLAVRARGIRGPGRPLAGVQVRLLADLQRHPGRGGDRARRHRPLRSTPAAWPRPMAPRALHATLGDDLVALDLDAGAFDLVDRGATGAASGAAGRLRLARPRDLPAGRDGAGRGAAARWRRRAARYPGAAQGAAAERQRLRRAGPGAAAGCGGPLADPAAQRRPGRGLDLRGAGRPGRAADRPRATSGWMPSSPNGWRSPPAPPPARWCPASLWRCRSRHASSMARRPPG